MKKYLFICLTALTLAGCGSGEKKEIVPVQLTHEVMDLPDAIIGSPGDMRKVGSYLIVTDFRQDSVFHLIDVKNREYLGMSGERGQGPDEFLRLVFIHPFGDGRLCSFDMRKYELKELTLDSIDRKITGNRILKVEPGWDTEMIPLPDGNFVTSGIYDGPMFNVVDKAGNILAQGGTYPYKDETEKKQSNQIRAMAYQGLMRVNSKGKMAFVTGSAQMIGIYQPTAREVKPIAEVIERYATYRIDANSPEEGYSVSHSAHEASAYNGLQVTDDYIYALYSGRKFADYKSEAIYECEHIHVFDWEGNRVGAYKLDVAIRCFYPDETEGKIYAIANLPDPVVVTFELPKD